TRLRCFNCGPGGALEIFDYVMQVNKYVKKVSDTV
ncbi:MAG: hypothetical protein ACD_75C01562G0001, partial [uncultured bacterium]